MSLTVTIAVTRASVSVPNASSTVSLQTISLRQSSFVSAIGLTGPAGPTGPTGQSGTDALVLASVNLSALRAITTDASGEAIYADNAAMNTSLVIGVSVSAALASDDVTVRIASLITDAGWTWTVGPVYLGTNGTLTQTAPTSGALTRIGVAIDATTIDIKVQQPILLG